MPTSKYRLRWEGLRDGAPEGIRTPSNAVAPRDRRLRASWFTLGSLGTLELVVRREKTLCARSSAG